MHPRNQHHERLEAELAAARRRIAELESAMAEQAGVESALRESEGRFRLLVESAPDAIFIKSEGLFAFLNQATLDLLGAERTDELLGTPFIDRIPQNFRENTRPRIKQISQTGGKPSVLAERLLRLDGTSVDVEMSSVPIMFEGKSSTLVFVRDITGRMKIENDLLDSQQRLAGILSWKESIINNSAVGILVVTKNRLITEVNSGFLEMFGFSTEELVGKSASILHTSQDKFREFGRQFWATTSKRKIVTTEWQMKRKNGEVFWCELTGSAINSRDIRQGVVWFIIDIDERKRLRETMVHSERMMTVGGLAAGMAHEINNPLGAILHSLQNITRRLSPEMPVNVRIAEEQGCPLGTVRSYLQSRQIFEFLDAIEHAGKRAARIVTNMLEFSQRGASSRISTNVNELIEKALDLCSALFDPEGRGSIVNILVERDFDPVAPKALCIPSQLEQVLVNLMQNAVQAMEDRPEAAPPARLVLRTRRDADSVRIEVEDNGPGMKPDVLRRAFDPFFTTKPEGQGTGLGLSVSYFIVTNNHGGTLEAKSSPGRGARFIIRLPA